MAVSSDRGIVAALVSWTVVAYFHALGRNRSYVVAIVLRFAIKRNRFLNINVFDICDTGSVVLVEGLVAVRHITLVKLAVLFLRSHVVKLAAVHIEARV